jgi:hypothetical protein
MEAHAPEFKSAAAPDRRAFRRRFSVMRNAGSLSDLTPEFQHLREPVYDGQNAPDLRTTHQLARLSKKSPRSPIPQLTGAL